MHYYKFNIADWVLATAHLSLEEEAIYFRLINHYYDSEQPIPLETQSVFRRLRLGSVSDTALKILEEFFEKTEKGFANKKCDELIKEYKKTVKKNKLNGSNGGRPRKYAASEETQSVSSGLPEETQMEPNHNPNHKPLTINQEPLTNIKKHTSSDVDSVFSHWCKTMQMRNAKLTSKRKKCIEDRIKEGYLLTDIFDAISGCASSAYHMGQNDTGTVYNDLTLILRSGDKLEQFIQKLSPVKPNPQTQNGGPGYGRKLSLAERTELETAKVLAMCEAEEAGYGSVAAYESALREQVGDGPGRRFSGGSVHGELLTLVSENGEAKR